MDEIISRLADRWYVKQSFLRDIYFLMLNDLRFASDRKGFGIDFAKVSRHLRQAYGVEIGPKQLRYLRFKVVTENRRKR